MLVVLPSSSGISVAWRGSRCWTTTNAIPVSGGTWAKNFWKASSPPADAPMPTTGAILVGERESGARVLAAAAARCLSASGRPAGLLEGFGITLREKDFLSLVLPCGGNCKCCSHCALPAPVLHVHTGMLVACDTAWHFSPTAASLVYSRLVSGDRRDASALRRTLGTADGLAVVLGITVGSGIFRTPGLVAAQLGRPSLIFAAWVMGGLVAFLGVLVFAELATRHPHAGGKYVFAREAYGRRAGFVVGW